MNFTDPNFDPAVHKIFAVDWSLTGTSFVIARDEGQAEDVTRSSWSEEKFRWLDEDALDCAARVASEDEIDDNGDDRPVGANMWGRHQLTLAAARRLIQHPHPTPEPVDRLRPLTDVEWLALAASFDYGRPAICSICVRDGRSAGCDGIRLHVVNHEVREPGQWDILTSEAVEEPYRAYPKWEGLLEGRNPRQAVTDLGSLWERLRAARDDRRDVALKDGDGVDVGVDPTYLMDILVGAVDEAGHAGRVLLENSGPATALAIFMPGRTALVMPKRTESARVVALDDLLEPIDHGGCE